MIIAILFAASMFQLSSPAFGPGSTMPETTVLNGLDCHGPNMSPALAWSGAPDGTKSYALILDDYEARGGDGFIHWVAYNIPATTVSLAENAGASEPDVQGGGKNAYNDFLRRRYDGPCPPEGPAHKYRFTVYALDLPSIDDTGTPMTWRKLRFIIRGHVLGEASLTGLKGHPLHARGEFDVKLTPIDKSHLSIAKTYRGDLDANGAADALTELTSVNDSRGIVAMEHVTGAIGTKRGSFTLQHFGMMNRGAQSYRVVIVPDSGTGDLAGISGEMQIDIRDGKHFYDLAYTLP